MDITPIKRVSVVEQVYQQLKQLILDDTWKPGDKIPSENELAEMFNVSRITIRQALQKLSALHLLETRLGEGSFIKELDPGESLNALIPVLYLSENTTTQAIEFRSIIDAECARLAATRATEEDIEDLKDILDMMEQCKNSLNLRGFANADLDFHFKIAQITQNPLIVKTNLILRDVLENSMLDVIDKMGCEHGLFYHREILRAIIEGDPDNAVRLMREHLHKNEEYFKL